MWTWGEDTPGRADRSYFARNHVNDTFPTRGAAKRQWPLGPVVTAVITAGMKLLSLAEYPEPYWRPGGVRWLRSAINVPETGGPTRGHPGADVTPGGTQGTGGPGGSR